MLPSSGRKDQNIIRALIRRERGCVSGCVGQLINRRCIPLSLVIDRAQQLRIGHVILGFSRSGNFLISYQCSLTDMYSYSLHLWKFNLLHPVQHVCEYELFKEDFERELHLIVSQSQDEQFIVVLGCMKAVEYEDRRTCHISIVPCPLLTNTELPWTTIHLKFDLLPPFPPFMPSLALRLPGCVLLNTGDRLVAVVYDSHQQVLTPHLTTTYSVVYRQTFSHNPAGGETVDSSPSHLLPVEVFQGDNQLSPQSSTAKGTVDVGQSVLDVEMWTNQVLCSELENKGLNYHSLLDYDLQIIEVNSDLGEVVFVIATLVEVTNSSGGINCYSLDLVGLWCVSTGLTTLKNVSSPKLITGPPVLTSTEATRLRNKYSLPCNPNLEIRAFSNHTVHSGKSVQHLHHPFLPLSIILG